MSRLSIIIPVFGELPPFEDTLVSVLENRPDDCQVLAAFNRPYSDPYGLEGEVQFVLASSNAGMAGLVNAALSACRAPCVHVLGCGVEVGPGWADAALGYCDDPRVAAVATLLLSRETPGRIVSAGIGCAAGGGVRYLAAGKRLAKQKAFFAPLGPDATAAFYRRSTLAALGGMPTDVGDELAGVELALRLHQAGYACALATECRLAYQKPVAATSALRRGWNAERHFWRWAAAYGWTRSLAAHALHLAGQVAAGVVQPSRFVEAVGRAAAVATLPILWPHAAKAISSDVACDDDAEITGDRRHAA